MQDNFFILFYFFFCIRVHIRQIAILGTAIHTHTLSLKIFYLLFLLCTALHTFFPVNVSFHDSLFSPAGPDSRRGAAPRCFHSPVIYPWVRNVTCLDPVNVRSAATLYTSVIKTWHISPVSKLKTCSDPHWKFPGPWKSILLAHVGKLVFHVSDHPDVPVI